MLTCPICARDITNANLSSGRCPLCGGLIWDEPDETSAGPSRSSEPPPPVIVDDRAPSIKDILSTIVHRSRTPAPQDPVDPGVRFPGAAVPEPPAPAPHASQPRAPESHILDGREPTTTAGTGRTQTPPGQPPEASPPDTPGTPPIGPAEPASPAIRATIDPRALSHSDLQNLATMWQQTISAASTPGMTLKSSTRATVVSSARSVRPRTLSTAQEKRLDAADYQLLNLIGEGGVGVVYAARQASINRTVAVKMLKPEITQDEDHRDKFLSEAVVTGELDHPNIVPIYELGADEAGRLFYSMKRVRGTPWSEVLQAKSLTENLGILMRIADAIAFAHSRGVIHRDLKPENVMLGDFGEVLVMDWGVALSTSLTMKQDSITQSTSMGGTPAYMAPELATGPIQAIGPPSDIYLIGAMLFEVITGNTPHSGRSVMDCLQNAARNVLQPTDKSGELLDIAYRAMATRPEDRYADVKEFQDAIRAYQAHSESIVLGERAQETLVTARATGDYQDYSRAVFSFRDALEMWDGNAAAAEGRDEATFEYARCAYEKGDFDLAASLLDTARPEHAALLKDIRRGQQERLHRQRRLKLARWTVLGLAALVFAVVSGFLVVVMRQKDDLAEANENIQKQKVIADENAANALAQKKRAEDEQKRAEDEQKRAEEEKNRAVVAEQEASQQRQKAEQASYVAQIGLAAERLANNAFDDARRLLNAYDSSDASDESDADSAQSQSQYRNWEWGHLRYLSDLASRTLKLADRVEAVAVDPQQRFILAGGASGVVSLWDAKTYALRGEIPHDEPVLAIAISPDGTRVATAGEGSGDIKVWELGSDGKEHSLVATLTGHAGPVRSLEFSPTQPTLLSSSEDGTARLWDLANGSELRALRGHFGPVWSAAFSPDGAQIVTAGEDVTVRIWQVDSSGSEKPIRFRQHSGPVFAATFSPDGQWIASAGRDKEILVWKPSDLPRTDFKQLEEALRKQFEGAVALVDSTAAVSSKDEIDVVRLTGHASEIHMLRFKNPGGDASGNRLLVSAANDNTVKVWDLAELPAGNVREVTFRGHGGWVRSAAFLPDEHCLVSGAYDGTVKIWDVRKYEEVRRLEGQDSPITAAALSPDTRQAVTVDRLGEGILWNLEDGQRIGSFLESSWSPSSENGLGSAERLAEGHEFLLTHAAFLPGGQQMLTAAGDGTVRLWDVISGGQIREFPRTGQASLLAVSGDGRWFVTGSDEGFVQVWDLAASPPTASRLEGFADVSAVAISQGGELQQLRVLTGHTGGKARLWRWDPATERWNAFVELSGHVPDHAITAARFLPGDRQVLTACMDYTVMRWDAETGQRLEAHTWKHAGEVRGIDLTSDGLRGVTVCLEGDERFWLTLWDLASSQALHRVAVKTASGAAAGTEARGDQGSDDLRGTITSLAADPLSDEAAYFVLVGEDGRSGLCRCDFATETAAWLASEQFGHEAAWSAVPTPDGSQILTVGGRSSRLWDLTSGLQEQSYRHHRALTTTDISPGGDRVVTAGNDGSFKIWSIRESADDFGRVLMKKTDAHGSRAGVAYRINSAVFAPADCGLDDLLLTAGDDGTIRLWDLSGPKPELRQTLSGHTRPVMQAVFSPDGRYLASGSLDGTARIWKLDLAGSTAAGQIVGGDRTHALGVRCLGFSEDGTRLATGGEDNTIKVWSVQGTVAEFAGILEGHTASVTSLAFSPDGRRLVSGSRDGMAKVWDTRTLEQVLNLGRHTDSVTAVCFSSDGSRILSASIDKSAIVWLAEPISPTILPSDVVRTYPATVEQMGEPMLVDVQIQLLDPDTRSFGGGSLRVAFDAEPDSASGERLDIRRIAVDGHRTLFRSGDQVQYGITGSEDTIGAIQGDAGGLEITLTDQATVPAVQALLRSISYASDTALPGTRRITFRMIDEHGAPSNLAHCDIVPAPAPAGN